ncbi:MAG: acetylxylan esterase [Bacteroidota bacterium]
MQTLYLLRKISPIRRGFSLLFFLILSVTGFSQLNVVADKTNGTYVAGTAMNFKVTSSSGGQVEWEIKYDNFAPTIASGTINVNPNQTALIPYTSSEAGVVICQVKKNGNVAIGSAAFSPFEIQPFEEEPSDFDAFWNSRKAALANVPINPVITFYQNNAYSTTYRMTLNNVDGRKVYGYITIPNGSGPFPAIVEIPPFGDAPNLAAPNPNLTEQGGVTTVAVSIHNVPADQVDPNAYEPDDIADKNGNYYRWAILGAIRSIDYLFTRNDFNGNDVGVTGVSQGAGLATIVAGLDNRVKLLGMSNPILSQNAGLKYNRAGGFPNYVKKSRDLFGTASHEAATVSATRYYDAAFHARRYDGPVYVNLSYEDLVTPAATGFATFNQLEGKKILLHSVELGHTHPFEYWIKRQDFIRRVFPVTLNTHPFPFSSDDQGYWADAGDDQAVSGSSASLSATIEKNGSVNPNFNLTWEKVSGPGNVNFNNPNAYNTSASFSSNGTYVLQFSGVDEAQLFSESKFFTISDRVTITVGSNGGNGNGGNNNTPPSGTLSTTATNVTAPFEVTANFSENIFGLTLSDLAVTNGTASNLTGSGNSFSFTITPQDVGVVTVNIPPYKFIDNQGQGNPTPTNTITVNFTNPSTGGGGGSSGGGDCNAPTNLALNKTATQHSTQFNAMASRALDGNTNGDFWGGSSVSLTNWVNNAWWEVDLGNVADIEQIKIWNRSDCCQNALSDYQILVSENPFNSTELSSAMNQAGVQSFYQANQAGTPTSVNINATGRYVRIQLEGQGFLALAEVEVLGCEGSSGGGGNTGGNNPGNGGNSDCNAPSNIAGVGTATQISTQFSGAAARAIDGNTEGSFWNPINSVSLTNWEVNTWWELDLGAVANIEEVKIWNRTDCCTEILKNYHVFISDVPFNSTGLDATINQSGVFDSFQSGVANRPSTVPVNRPGRYLRIQLSDQGFLALAEVEVMGCFVNNNISTLIAQPEVLDFNAVQADRSVQLGWVTNTEVSNDYFIVEKSSDGVDFQTLMTTESERDAAGYYFYDGVDDAPDYGKNYYRLLRVEKDGTASYSNIKEVTFNIDIDDFAIYPNPANDRIFVNLKPFAGREIQMQIFDARGVLMEERNIDALGATTQNFDLKNYTNGLYILTTKPEGLGMITKQFIIANPK